MPTTPKPAAKPAAEKPQKDPSPFVVLRPYKLADAPAAENGENGDTNVEPKPLFEQVGEFTSKTSKGAIALAIGEHGGGDYIAVPARSFVVRSAQPAGAPRLKWN